MHLDAFEISYSFSDKAGFLGSIIHKAFKKLVFVPLEMSASVLCKLSVKS